MRRYSHYFLFVVISFTSLYLQYNVGSFKPIIFHDSPYPIDTLSLFDKFGSLWREIANFCFFYPFGTFFLILYLANPFSIFYIWRILNANIILHAMLPLIFLSVIKIINAENSRKYIVVLLFTEFLSIPGFANLAYYVSFAFITLLLSISYNILARFSSKISF